MYLLNSYSGLWSTTNRNKSTGCNFNAQR